MEFSAILTIAYYELKKLQHEPIRLVSELVVPLILIVTSGEILQLNIGARTPYDFRTITMSGIFALTLFYSTAKRLFRFKERANALNQEIFVAPISYSAIIIGKLLGASLATLPQCLVILIFALVVRLPLSTYQIASLVGVAILICLLGGTFGLMLAFVLRNQPSAERIFLVLIAVQVVTSGVFFPLQFLPPVLDFISRLSPLRYAVDLTRSTYYAGQIDYPRVVSADPLFNLLIICLMSVLFLMVSVPFARRGRYLHE